VKKIKRETKVVAPGGDHKRETIWNIMDQAKPFVPNPPSEPILNPSERKSPDAHTKVFFVHLTTWNGVPFLVRYNTAEDFPMEPAEAGGTYIFYGYKIFYVQESREEVNAKILQRLQQLQKNWVA
jgi:uncharacterized protein YlzI (FlbEa/FlbD family)